MISCGKNRMNRSLAMRQACTALLNEASRARRCTQPGKGKKAEKENEDESASIAIARSKNISPVVAVVPAQKIDRRLSCSVTSTCFTLCVSLTL